MIDEQECLCQWVFYPVQQDPAEADWERRFYWQSTVWYREAKQYISPNCPVHVELLRPMVAEAVERFKDKFPEVLKLSDRLRAARDDDRLLEFEFQREYGKEYMLVSLDYILQEQRRRRGPGEVEVFGTGEVDLSGRTSWILRRFTDGRDQLAWGMTVGVELVSKPIPGYEHSWIVPFSDGDEFFWMLEGEAEGENGERKVGRGHCSDCHHVCSAWCGRRHGGTLSCPHTMGCPEC